MTGTCVVEGMRKGSETKSVAAAMDRVYVRMDGISLGRLCLRIVPVKGKGAPDH